MLGVESEPFNPPHTGMVCHFCGSSTPWLQQKPIQAGGYFYCDTNCYNHYDLKVEEYDCRKCGWTVKPWYIGCEACGDPEPYKPPPIDMYFCTTCHSESTVQEEVETCCSLEEDEWVDIDEALADLEDEKRYQQQETP